MHNSKDKDRNEVSTTFKPIKSSIQNVLMTDKIFPVLSFFSIFAPYVEEI